MACKHHFQRRVSNSVGMNSDCRGPSQNIVSNKKASTKPWKSIWQRAQIHSTAYWLPMIADSTAFSHPRLLGGSVPWVWTWFTKILRTDESVYKMWDLTSVHTKLLPSFTNEVTHVQLQTSRTGLVIFHCVLLHSSANAALQFPWNFVEHGPTNHLFILLQFEGFP